jgi:uncharacterized protein
VIAVDTNVLVYAHRSDSPFHDASKTAIAALAEGDRTWAIPWPCVHEFYSVVTHERIYDPPSTVDQAIEQLAAWAESPTLRFIGERPDHVTWLAELVRDADIRGPKVHDARIAAICVSHGVERLITLDRDFARFPRLATQSPLTG